MDSQWLQTQFRLNPGKSKADLARVLGLEPPAISKILGGGRQIKAQEYALMRRFFGLPVDGEVSLNTAPAGFSRELEEKADGNGFTYSTSYKPLPARPAENLSEKLRVFRVEEPVMEPDYFQGEHVLVDTTQKSLEPPGVFVICDGFTYMIRNCAYASHADKGKVQVSARKKDFQAQILEPNEFLVIGRVVAKILWT
ncbi:MAG: XRE family transcriptional regulator [Alphaproteobacteria bacterium]|nr:XRE family transcriptional regulator [Alphaproteobacteria bacterium]